MSTTQITAILFQLQQLDLELDRLHAEQQRLVQALQGHAGLQRLRAEHAQAVRQLHSGQQVQKEAEWSLEEVNRRLKAQEQRLYSGTGSNTKDLSSLQQEVQRLQLQQHHQEEKLLEDMDATESLNEVEQQKAEALQKAENAWQQESATLVERRNELETRRQRLQIQRSQLAERIEPAMLQRYDAMRRTKQGRAISKVEHNACQWCRVILTPSELQHIRISTELQTCTNCGRILYYDR